MALGIPMAMSAFAPTAGAGTQATPIADQLRSTAHAFAGASAANGMLAGTSDADLAVNAVRCLPLDGRTYCLHIGWVDHAPSAAELRDRVGAEAAIARRATTSTELDARGDMPLSVQLRNWANQPRETRVAQEKGELDQAIQALGKVKLWDQVTAGKPVPSDLVERYPELAGQIQQLGYRDGRSAAQIDEGGVGDPNRGQKQINSYYCGPTSFLAMAWTDPRRGDELSPGNGYTQQFWAGRLGTTTDGTAITAINANINTHLTWKNVIGDYVVVGISGWNVARWQNLFRNHLIKAPVQLHPVLYEGNNKYRMTTGGHFNVARAFNFNPNNPVWQISIYEPAGGSRVPVSFWEDHANIIDQNHRHPMKNISY
nr:hypothetical protein [Kibdelosporangium sp. MJ126-NF4]CEL23237.1 large tegument protein [Kibdelosporangium sp. MJ126-NF4]CTQ94399.1 large tegument protein [Kibdelosporangium sp. MJ126-NF4]